MLSAKDSVMDKVNGLQIGADDYIAKPYNLNDVVETLNKYIDD